MASKSRPSRRSLLKLLTEAAFDPRADGPLSVVVDMNDPHYCELKAVELISEARRCLGQENPSSREYLKQQYHERITQAMGLLALARLQRDVT